MVDATALAAKGYVQNGCWNGDPNYPVIEYISNNEVVVIQKSSIERVTKSNFYYRLSTNRSRSDSILDAITIVSFCIILDQNSSDDDGVHYFFKRVNGNIKYTSKGDGGKWNPKWRNIGTNYIGEYDPTTYKIYDIIVNEIGYDL